MRNELAPDAAAGGLQLQLSADGTGLRCFLTPAPQLQGVRDEPAPDRRGRRSGFLGGRAAVRPGAGSSQLWRARDEPAPDSCGRGFGSGSSCLRDRAAVRPGAGSPQLQRAQEEPAPDHHESGCLRDRAAVRPGAGSPQLQRARDEPALVRRCRSSSFSFSVLGELAAVLPGTGLPQLQLAQEEPVSGCRGHRSGCLRDRGSGTTRCWLTAAPSSVGRASNRFPWPRLQLQLQLLEGLGCGDSWRWLTAAPASVE